MCSHFEEFGNAPAEAMAVGLPLVLNDHVMKEVSKGNALFYESNSIESLAKILLEFGKNKEALLKLSEQWKFIARKLYYPEFLFSTI